MKPSFYRTAMVLGEEAEQRLDGACAVVFGVGGVGGHCVDALARCGVGNLFLIDSACVKQSNLNRQICAKKSTIGMKKVEAMKMHVEDVSDCRVIAVDAFAMPENICELIPENADIVIDAVDTVTAKIAVIIEAKRRGIPVLSSMGAGNRFDPTCVRSTDIYKTSIDPLARVMRRELKKRGVEELTVVYSTEEPIVPLIPTPDPDMKPNAPASVPFVPGAFGLALAKLAVEEILKNRNGDEFLNEPQKY